MTDSPIFIVGCPRSGTKLIRDLLRSHSHITFPPESHFIPQIYRLYGNPRNEDEAVKIASAILDIHWVKRFGLSLTPSSFSGCRSYGEIVSAIFQEWARVEGKPRWGDKTPQYVTDIPALVEIFPSCKIIHIYRDGRDVALSLRKQWFGPGNVYTAARAWKRMMVKGRRDGRTAGPERYFELRYETLLERPRETMEEVCGFIGEPFTEAVLTPNFIKSELKRSSRYGTKTGILKGNHGKWRKQMPEADRAVFESIAGDLLDELGYETEGCTRKIAAHEKFFWTAQDYCHFIWQRRNKIAASGWLKGELFLRWANMMGASKPKDRE